MRGPQSQVVVRDGEDVSTGVPDRRRPASVGHVGDGRGGRAAGCGFAGGAGSGWCAGGDRWGVGRRRRCEADGPVWHPLALDASVRGVGRDPDSGRGALDRLAVAHACGVTHFLLPAQSAWWLQRYADLAEHLARRATVTASNASGTLWESVSCSDPGGPRVFGIGLSKTGTSSLHEALTLLGFDSFHWGGRGACTMCSRRGSARVFVGFCTTWASNTTVHSDIGTLSVRFDLADLQYPGVAVHLDSSATSTSGSTVAGGMPSATIVTG